MNESKQGPINNEGQEDLTDQEKAQQARELEQKRQLIDDFRRRLMDAQQENNQL